MTREEALQRIVDNNFAGEYGFDLQILVDCMAAAREIILNSQFPSEDCISREEVCDYIAEFVNHEYATDREREMVKHIIGGIQHLPSIHPKPKTGWWVGVNPMVDTLMCSECGENIISEEFKSNYCPNCGAKMEDYEET